MRWPMRTSLLAAAALLLAASPALADTLVDNANGIQVDAQGKSAEASRAYMLG